MVDDDDVASSGSDGIGETSSVGDAIDGTEGIEGETSNWKEGVGGAGGSSDTDDFRVFFEERGFTI